MTWVGIDDAILDNPKIARVGPIGFALHVAAITYCARNLTDGYLPYGQVRRLLPTVFSGAKDEDGRTKRWSLSLVCGMTGMDGEEVIDFMENLMVAAGLWEPDAVGYRLHDYHDWNPSRKEVLARREAASEAKVRAGRAGGKRSVEVRVARYGSANPRSEYNYEASPEAAGEPGPEAVGEAEREAQGEPAMKPHTHVKESSKELLSDSADKRPKPESKRGLVWDLWLEITSRTGRTQYEGKRVLRLEWALKSYSLDDCLDAVRGITLSPHHMGVNEAGKTYNDLTHIFADASKLEGYRDAWRRRGKPSNGHAARTFEEDLALDAANAKKYQPWLT